MYLLFIIILILGIIILFKTKKIRKIHKNLLKKESIIYELYGQKFNILLKMMNETDVNISGSIFMVIGELRKSSVFLKSKGDLKGFVLLGDKISKLIKYSIEENLLNKEQSLFIDNEKLIKELNAVIQNTKFDFNNLVEHYNQEKNDFFGKNIFKLMKNLKSFVTL